MVDYNIVGAIKNYADKEGGGYSNRYCGIASDPQRRLNDHNVTALWIYRDAGSEQNARDTEAYLLQLGFDGNTGGGNYSTTHVYAYKKISGITRE